MKDDLLRQALNALEHHTVQTRPIHNTELAIDALRAALAAPQPEPACPVCQGEPTWEHDARTNEWAGRCRHCGIEGSVAKTEDGAKRAWADWYSKRAAPAVQPLTDEQIDAISLRDGGVTYRQLARAVERAHGIGDSK